MTATPANAERRRGELGLMAEEKVGTQDSDTHAPVDLSEPGL